MLTEEKVMRALSEIMHPEIDYSLVDLGMIKDIRIESEKIIVTMNLPFPGIPIKDALARMVTEAVTREDETSQPEVQFATMSEEERIEFVRKAREKWKS